MVVVVVVVWCHGGGGGGGGEGDRGCCCCCSHINSSPQYNAVRGRRTGSNNSGVEEYLGKNKNITKNNTHDI